jgi:predicted nucleic acid-binding protein
MASPSRPRIFLDTSTLFAGVWSETGGARMLFKLAEAGNIDLLVSAEVLTEAEAVIRRKAPSNLAFQTLLLDCARVSMVPAADSEILQQCEVLVSDQADAVIVAAAWAARPDYFVTLDRRHLLGNAPLAAAVPFPVGTPGDCLEWYRKQLAPG